MKWTVLPALNAALNGAAAVLLLSGFYFIKHKQKDRHRLCMLSAVTCSGLFLISYLVYHFGHAGLTKFAAHGWPRVLYFSILWTHTPLAATIVPMIIITLRRALRSDFAAHRRLARWLLPLWLYVSVTGVLIYYMLYHWFPSVTVPN